MAGERWRAKPSPRSSATNWYSSSTPTMPLRRLPSSISREATAKADAAMAELLEQEAAEETKKAKKKKKKKTSKQKVKQKAPAPIVGLAGR